MAPDGSPAGLAGSAEFGGGTDAAGPHRANGHSETDLDLSADGTVFDPDAPSRAGDLYLGDRLPGDPYALHDGHGRALFRSGPRTTRLLPADGPGGRFGFRPRPGDSDDGDDPFAETPALLRKRHLAQALRPFKRLTSPDPREQELDEEATATRAAEDGLWLAVCRPVRDRVLDLDVIVDASRFAALYRPMTAAFLESIGTVGAFRRIRPYLFDTDVADPDALALQSLGPAGLRTPAAALTRLGSPQNRLVLVLTDGVGDAWHSGAAQRVLAGWGRSCPVAIVHLLRRRQWRRTGIATRAAKLHSHGPAIPNGRYRATFPPAHSGPGFEPRVGTEPRVGSEPDPAASTAPHPPGPVCVPVFELEPGQLAGWTRLVTASERVWSGSVTLCPAAPGGAVRDDDDSGADADSHGASQEDGPFTPAELVQRFRTATTPTIFALAVHLAAAPLSLPVMRLVQRTMLPRSGPSDLSELIGSGLLHWVGPDGGLDPVDETAVTYDYRPGVRQELLAAGRRSDTTRVLITVADNLGDRVSLLRDLRELVIAPRHAELPPVTAELAPLAAPALEAFKALAGPYAAPARRLQAALSSAATTAPDSLSRAKEGKELTHQKADLPAPKGKSADMSLDQKHLTNQRPNTLDKAPFFGVGVAIRTIPPAAEREPSEPPPIWGNIPPRNPNFTGREELLEMLHKRLSKGTTAVLPEALHGMGGVGKSQIAIEYVYRHIQDYDLVWWIPSERQGQIQQGLIELAGQLSLPVSHEVNIAVPAVREALRLGRPYRNWLLVFDNAEQLDEVRDFFPTNGPGKILVTSRNQAWTRVARSLEVDVFARDESKALLRLRGPELNDAAADELAELLGDLPLAIEQAAVWLAETGMPVEEYLHLFREKHDKAAELLHDTAPVAYELPVAAAWNVSLDQLRATNPAALQLLQVCAFFAPEPISRRLLSGTRNVEGPAELMEALSDPIKLGRAVRAIQQYALARISHKHNTIMLHRLVQRVLVAQMSASEAAEFRHCGHQLLAQADPNQPDRAVHWPDYAELLPHVLHSELVDCSDSWARELFLNEIDFQFQWGDHAAFLRLAQAAVDRWTGKLGEQNDQTLTARLHLGRALRLHGRFKEAYEHHTRVREILTENHGADDERTLDAQAYVGADLRYLGRFAEALELDEHSFSVLQRRFGPDDPTTLQQAHMLGIDLRLAGNPEKALELDTDTHQRLVTMFGGDHARALGSQAAVAIDEMECGNYIEARNIMRHNTERLRAIFGPDYRGLAEGLSILSVTERKAGDHETALKLSTEALELCIKRYGPDHPGSLGAALNHGINLRQMERLTESIALSQETLQRHVSIYGTQHPNTQIASINLAVALRLTDEPAVARELDESSLATLTAVLGPDHPRSIVCAINLASDLYALSDYTLALQMDREALERAGRILGAEHPTTLACALNLSLDLRQLDEQTEAELRFVEATATLRRVLGDNHPGTISAHRSIRADCDIYPIPI